MNNALAVVKTTGAHHCELALNAKFSRRQILAEPHLLSQVFVVELGVDAHEHSQALVHLSILLFFEQHVLAKQHQILVQVVGNFHGEEWLEKHLNDVAEADNEHVQLVNGLRCQCRFWPILIVSFIL